MNCPVCGHAEHYGRCFALVGKGQCQCAERRKVNDRDRVLVPSGVQRATPVAVLAAARAMTTEQVSVCCGAPELAPGGRCGRCQEHTSFEAVVTGPLCRGAHPSLGAGNVQEDYCQECGVPVCRTCWGKREVEPPESSIGSPWPVRCWTCQGSGVAE